MEFVFPSNPKKELFCALYVALLLLLTTVTSAEEGAQEKNSQCHNYAGGHVYPGEAFRVPVSDHSLHLSKAKSEFLSGFQLQVVNWYLRSLKRADVRFNSCYSYSMVCWQDNRNNLALSVCSLCSLFISLSRCLIHI